MGNAYTPQQPTSAAAAAAEAAANRSSQPQQKQQPTAIASRSSQPQQPTAAASRSSQPQQPTAAASRSSQLQLGYCRCGRVATFAREAHTPPEQQPAAASTAPRLSPAGCKGGVSVYVWSPKNARVAKFPTVHTSVPHDAVPCLAPATPRHVTPLSTNPAPTPLSHSRSVACLPACLNLPVLSTCLLA